MEEAIAAVSTQATNSQENPLAGFGPNEWIVEDMYQRYLADPTSVDRSEPAAPARNRSLKAAVRRPRRASAR